MNKLFFTLLFALIGTTVFAQEIDIKDDIVTIDGKQCLKIGGGANNVSIMDMEGNEIVFLKFIHGSKYGKVYNKITFLEQKVSFTSQSYIFTKKLLIKKLVQDKTLSDCKLDPDKVEKFALKMDENIEKD
jgi:hypothetical protein